jgi:hypothetical protein
VGVAYASAEVAAHVGSTAAPPRWQCGAPWGTPWVTAGIWLLVGDTIWLAVGAGLAMGVAKCGAGDGAWTCDADCACDATPLLSSMNALPAEWATAASAERAAALASACFRAATAAWRAGLDGAWIAGLDGGGAARMLDGASRHTSDTSTCAPAAAAAASAAAVDAALAAAAAPSACF